MIRFRCLEAIVNGAFPDEPRSTVEDLVRLGSRLGYEMPQLLSTSRSDVDTNMLVQTRKPRVAESTLDMSGASAPETQLATETGEQNAMLKDSSDREHYIGPSGTLRFLIELRRVFQSSRTTTETSSNTLTNETHLVTPQTLEADGEAPNQPSPNMTSACAFQEPSPTSVTSKIAHDFGRPTGIDYNSVLSQLPPDEVMELLIHSYFKFAHDDFPLFQRTYFEKQYETFVVQARRRSQLRSVAPVSPPDWAWIGCLYMVIVLGSISNPSIGGMDHNLVRLRYVTATRALLPQLVSKCTLSSVRALLLLALFLHNNSERNAAWNLTGTAIRIAISLGLHRFDYNEGSPLQARGSQACRFLVLHTLYSFEVFLSTSLGRPSSMDGICGLERLNSKGSWPAVEGGAFEPELFAYSWRLSRILSKTDKPSATPESILKELAKWKADISKSEMWDLPTISYRDVTGGVRDVNERVVEHEAVELSLSWRPRSQLRSLLLLHIHFHYIALITTRSYLLSDIAAALRNIQRPEPSRTSKSHLGSTCAFHAHQLSFIFLMLESTNTLSGLIGLDIFYGYWAGMLLNLMLLRSPQAPTTPKLEDESSDVSPYNHASVKELVSNVQTVIKRAVKGGTMKRLSNVMDTFVD